VYRVKDGRCVGEHEDANVKRRYVSVQKLLADRCEGVA